jgi:hypothetical protein
MSVVSPPVIVVGVLVATLCGCSRSHPSDRELLETFSKKRDQFELLISMFEGDQALGRVGRGFTRPEDPASVGITSDRIARYRELCRAIGARSCIEGYGRAYYESVGWEEPFPREGKEPIWLHVSARGLAISGSSKGYCYSSTPPGEILDSLDALSGRSGTQRESGTWFRPIAGNWYLYYDREA